MLDGIKAEQSSRISRLRLPDPMRQADVHPDVGHITVSRLPQHTVPKQTLAHNLMLGPARAGDRHPAHPRLHRLQLARLLRRRHRLPGVLVQPLRHQLRHAGPALRLPARGLHPRRRRRDAGPDHAERHPVRNGRLRPLRRPGRAQEALRLGADHLDPSYGRLGLVLPGLHAGGCGCGGRPEVFDEHLRVHHLFPLYARIRYRSRGR